MLKVRIFLLRMPCSYLNAAKKKKNGFLEISDIGIVFDVPKYLKLYFCSLAIGMSIEICFMRTTGISATFLRAYLNIGTMW